jgi:hypothetical protein
MSAEKEELRALRAEIAKLRAQLKQLNGHSEGTTISGTSLDKHQAERYARHIVLRSFGLPGRSPQTTQSSYSSPCLLQLSEVWWCNVSPFESYQITNEKEPNEK